MVKQYVKTVEEHRRMVISMHQRDWDERLPIFLLAYKASTHETTDMMPASMLFMRELHLSCDLLFRALLNKEQSMTDYVVDFVNRLHDIHHYAYQHLKVASDRTAWLIPWDSRKETKSSCIDDVVYRIQ
jgi:hypothetical protein